MATMRGRVGERRPRLHLTLEPDVLATLRGWDRGARSRYVSQALRERWAAWQSGLLLLRQHGWMRQELHAALDALNGLWMRDDAGYEHLGPGLALELHDAERLNGTATRQHEVDPRVWEARVQQIAQSEALARALRCVVTEWWASNPACERAVERMDER